MNIGILVAFVAMVVLSFFIGAVVGFSKGAADCCEKWENYLNKKEKTICELRNKIKKMSI